MAYNQILKERLRTALASTPHVEEKKMFGGIAFLVNGKMCINVGSDRIMFRIDPEMHEQALKRNGCSTVIMRGHEYRGFVYVNEDGLRLDSDFNYWVGLALDFNLKAKATERKKRA